MSACILFGYFLSLFSFCCITSNPKITNCEITSSLFGSLSEKWDLKWKEPSSSEWAGSAGSVWNCPSMNIENRGRDVNPNYFCRLLSHSSFLPHLPTPVGLHNMQSVLQASALWQDCTGKEKEIFSVAHAYISYPGSEWRIWQWNWKSTLWLKNVFNLDLRKTDKPVGPSLLFTKLFALMNKFSSVQYRQFPEGFWNGN